MEADGTALQAAPAGSQEAAQNVKAQKPASNGLAVSKRFHRVFTTLLRDAPDEVNRTSVHSAYFDYRLQTDTREPYRIPAEYLVGTKKFVGPGVADTPLIVFINAKSGGRVGPRLLNVLFRSVGQAQVFDLAESRPGPVLEAIWANLSAEEERGDELAGHIRRNLRILAAGGDGTVTWILKTIRELRLDPPPAVAVMPLGTGNDLSLSFGWGNAFQERWIAPAQLYTTLKRFAVAPLRALDCWAVTVTAPQPGFFTELPYALAVQPDNAREARGLFWNYLSVGLDAEAAYGFHTLRESYSWAASHRLLNQAWYSWYSCTSGWFCGAQPLTNKLQLRVRDRAGGPWRSVAVPRRVKALVLLNIQSYGGGRDIVGLGDSMLLEGQQFRQPPIFDDGLIEVVGFGSGWHAALTMAQVSSRLHAVRLAQCAEVELRMEARGGKVAGEQGCTHMQVDGEPWRQPIPAAPQALRQRRMRPSGLRESEGPRAAEPAGPAEAAAAPGADPSLQQAAAQPQTKQQAEQQRAGSSLQGGADDSQQVVVRVAHAGTSHMLLNEQEPQGGRRVRTIAARGSRLSTQPDRQFSMLWPAHVA